MREVLRYRGPKAYPTTLTRLEAGYRKPAKPWRPLVLAMRTKNDRRHIGNIALNTILWPHRSAELFSIIDRREETFGERATPRMPSRAFDGARFRYARLDGTAPTLGRTSAQPRCFNEVVRKARLARRRTKRALLLLYGPWFPDFISPLAYRFDRESALRWSILDREWRGRQRTQRMIAVANYGIGNLRSVVNALAAAGAPFRIVTDPDTLADFDKVILPGVGAFGACMEALELKGFKEPILEHAAAGKPLLGICVGMQLLADRGEEFGEHDGLGLISDPWFRSRAPATV